MSNFALVVVPAGWDDKTPLTFSNAQYEAIRDSAHPGTEIILFRGEPENIIIGQGQVRAPFLKTSEWPAQNLGDIDPSNPDMAYALPIEVLFRLKAPVAPLAQVRDALRDPSFPQPGEHWRALKQDEYDALRDGWM